MSLSKKFERYTPVEPLYGNVSYSRNADGDWYEQQKNFAEDTLKILYDDGGRISAFTRDVSQLPDPTGFYVAELSVKAIDIDKQRFIGGELVEYQKSKEELKTEADAKKQALIAEATRMIAPLQDAVDLGIATDAETGAHNAWRTYRVQLMRVDTENPEWPAKPV
ncbi:MULTISPECIES: tail fiber assembly protein [Enterobacteriaceae]|uniref:tail fiber assembly protein n=1 Tax=Enterobacteriaceae TaxID=543 RepID=UPI0007A584C1|nr:MULTISPECIES: tail fiber assembly protein [Enterobacteriaceae]HDC4771986.1 tail fiber assembly protein [Enterobacter cloacae]HEO1691445.1 tail fiber assembly protein [Citrobacter freundii]QLO85780.1 tail fiber assembly protein [Citrobacter sp. RHBSTW-00944]QLX41039.1 tail fiber assembly protein [Citrobacter sp. RHBSTW-00229]SQR09143.1 tail fiber assembly protein [Escherichia coli]